MIDEKKLAEVNERLRRAFESTMNPAWSREDKQDDRPDSVNDRLQVLEFRRDPPGWTVAAAVALGFVVGSLLLALFHFSAG